MATVKLEHEQKRNYDPYEVEETPRYREQVIDPWNYGWALILALVIWSLIGVGFLVASTFVNNVMLGINLTVIGWIVIVFKAVSAYYEVKRAWRTHKEILEDQ